MQAIAVLAYLFHLAGRRGSRPNVAAYLDSGDPLSRRSAPEASAPPPSGATNRPVGHAWSAQEATARWIDEGATATVAGRDLGGMLYLGPEPRRQGGWGGGSPFIDPALPVADVGLDYSGESMSYWPSYSEITPQARASYLDWLAGGRSDPRYGPGFVFLFFYGLERRFFLDSPSASEAHVLLGEGERLLRIYGDNHSVRRYLTTFVEAAQVVVRRDLQPDHESGRSGHELPLGLRVAVGRVLREGRPLSGEWLLSWYVAHPETRLRMPAIRAEPEFRALFLQLFAERFPRGLRVSPPKRLVRYSYVAASGTFEVDLKRFIGDVPDIAVTSKSLNIAKQIAEAATDALDKYSRFLGRSPDGRGTIEGHALLPESLWSLFPCEELNSLHDWASKVIDAGGLVPVEQVVEQLEGRLPEKVAKRQLTGAADALARLSIGMAPDPRFGLRNPKFGEPVVLFLLPEGVTALEEVSAAYKSLLVAIAVGGFVAHADGTVAAQERSALEARIGAAPLPAVERARLHANLKWMLAVPPNLALFRRRLAGAPEETRREIGQLALAMALSDGLIASGEISAVEKLYKAIGLPADDVYSHLHALTLRAEPVTVRPADEDVSEFAIPSSPERSDRVALDAKRLASLTADTARVSALLGEIFAEGEAEEPEETATESPNESPTLFPGLDARHSNFLLELLTRPEWSEREFSALAAQFRLMEAGSLETLNEWSYERFGDLLIDEYEGYEINPDVAGELRSLE